MASEASGVAGSMSGAVGALYQGQAQSDALDHAAAVARQNAALDLESGNANAGRLETMATKKIGATEAAFGAAGLTSDSGSALAVLAASHANAELDRQNILHGAQVRAINYNNQAAMDEVGAKSALQASYFNAISSITMGGAKAFGNRSGASQEYSPSSDNNAEEGYSDGSGGGSGAEWGEGGGVDAVGGGGEELAFV